LPTTGTTEDPAPGPPTAVKAILGTTKTEVMVSWSAPADVSNVKNYSVYRAVGSGAAAKIGDAGKAPPHNFVDPTPVAGAANVYHVVANAVVGNNSPVSTTASVDVPAPIPTGGV
jgi:hypothetical protein